MSQNTILKNFTLHSSMIPDQTMGMEVVTIGNLKTVNSGLPCDTFNTIHVEGSFNSEELHEALNLFKANTFPFCCWISKEFLSEQSLQCLKDAGLHCQAEEVGMILDLTHYTPVKSEKHQHIKRATTPEMIREFGNVIAENWSPPDQQVIAFYEKTAKHFIAEQERISLFTYDQGKTPVATVEVFASNDQVVGIHGLATLEDTRGQGIGSALMTKALNDAKSKGFKSAVLLATPDGLGIYKKLGFQTSTTFYEYA